MNYIAINNEYYRCPEFIEFGKKVHSRILEFVIAHTVRNGGTGRKYIFDNYYMKGKLVSRFSQDDIASYFSTSQGNISRYLSVLESMKLIRKIPRYIKRTRILYYEVGRWSGELDGKTYKETLYFDVVFGAFSKAAKDFRKMNKGDYGTREEIEKLIKKLDPADMWYDEDLAHYKRELALLNGDDM